MNQQRKPQRNFKGSHLSIRKQKIISLDSSTVSQTTNTPQLLSLPLPQSLPQPLPQPQVQPSNLYQKVKPAQLEEFNEEEILKIFNSIQKSGKPTVSLKEKKKETIYRVDNQKKYFRIGSKMQLNKSSYELINQFEKIMRLRFVGKLSQLQRQRIIKMKKLFNVLCFGYQQIQEGCEVIQQSINILEKVSKQDLLELLKDTVFKIDSQILDHQNQGKQDKITFKFKSQWKFILELVSNIGNQKLRAAIVTGQLNPTTLSYAKQIDLVDYLEQSKQKKYKAELDNILKQAVPWEQKILLQQQKLLLKHDQVYEDLDSHTTNCTTDFEFIQSVLKWKPKREKPGQGKEAGLLFDPEEDDEVKEVIEASKNRKIVKKQKYS